MKTRAFTLIELLVVIAIIAILAAILFPVFAQAKLAAKKTVALSNAKQVALSNLIYQGDFDDHLVKSYFGFPGDCNSWQNTYYNWRFALQPYAKSSGLFTDPTNQFTSPNFDTQSWTDGNTVQTLPMNYAVNDAVIGFANGQCASPQYCPDGLDTLDSVQDIAGTITIVPNRTRWNDLKFVYLSPVYDGGPPGWCDQTPSQVASGSSTCPAVGMGGIQANSKITSFCWGDGHAKAMNVLATLQTNNPTFDNWGTQYYHYNPLNGSTTPPVQQDRINVAANAYPEYLH